MFGKDITQKMVGDAMCHWFTLPFFADHHLSRHFREKHTKGLLVVFLGLLAAATVSSVAELHGFFCIELSLLIYEWCDSCELDCCYHDIEDCNLPQRSTSKEVHILLCPINLSFPLHLMVGGLDGG